MGFGGDLGGGAKYLVGNYIRPQNCTFSDMFGPDLTRRAVAFCVGIAICHMRKFGQVWVSPAPLSEVGGKLRCRYAPLWTIDYHMEKIVIILRRNPWAVAGHRKVRFRGFVWGK